MKKHFVIAAAVIVVVGGIGVWQVHNARSTNTMPGKTAPEQAPAAQPPGLKGSSQEQSSPEQRTGDAPTCTCGCGKSILNCECETAQRMKEDYDPAG